MKKLIILILLSPFLGYAAPSERVTFSFIKEKFSNVLTYSGEFKGIKYYSDTRILKVEHEKYCSIIYKQISCESTKTHYLINDSDKISHKKYKFSFNDINEEDIILKSEKVKPSGNTYIDDTLVGTVNLDSFILTDKFNATKITNTMKHMAKIFQDQF